MALSSGQDMGNGGWKQVMEGEGGDDMMSRTPRDLHHRAPTPGTRTPVEPYEPLMSKGILDGQSRDMRCSDY
jgi:hypothetical protein